MALFLFGCFAIPCKAKLFKAVDSFTIELEEFNSIRVSANLNIEIVLIKEKKPHLLVEIGDSSYKLDADKFKKLYNFEQCSTWINLKGGSKDEQDKLKLTFFTSSIENISLNNNASVTVRGDLKANDLHLRVYDTSQFFIRKMDTKKSNIFCKDKAKLIIDSVNIGHLELLASEESIVTINKINLAKKVYLDCYHSAEITIKSVKQATNIKAYCYDDSKCKILNQNTTDLFVKCFHNSPVVLSGKTVSFTWNGRHKDKINIDKLSTEKTFKQHSSLEDYLSSILDDDSII